MKSCAALALVLSGSTTAYAESAAPAAHLAHHVTMVTPPEHDPAELEVLFWNDAQRSDRFRNMEAWFAGYEVSSADRKSTRLNSSHVRTSRMPSSA